MVERMYISLTIPDHELYPGFDYEYELQEVGNAAYWEVTTFHVSSVVGALFAVECIRESDSSVIRRRAYDSVIEELSLHFQQNGGNDGFSAATLASCRRYLIVFDRIRQLDEVTVGRRIAHYLQRVR